MSTIGEALRKVQKQRSAGMPPPADAPHELFSKQPPPQVHSSRAPVFIAILIGVFLVSGVVLYFSRGITFSIVAEGRTVPGAGTSPASSQAPLAGPDPVLSPSPAVPATPTPSGTVVGEIVAAPGTNSPVVAAVDSTQGAKERVVTPSFRNSTTRANLPILGGIFYSEKNPVAILNGSSMMEGEKAGGFLIVKINVYSVTLRDENGDIEIRLK